jgi:uncharacterized membrane-anchored protein
MPASPPGAELPVVPDAASVPSGVMAHEVPAVTAVFWIVKVLSTTVGETGADCLAVHAELGAATAGAVMAILLAGALVLQMRARRYVPWIYWSSVVLVSIVGTQITDALTDNLELSRCASTAAFAAVLATIFALWYASERTLSIRTIVTSRRETFCWVGILFTFALAKGAGDLAIEAPGLGFRLGVLAFGGLVGLVALAHRFGQGAITSFWVAYILTRPLGTAVGDLLSQSRPNGGLGLGTSTTSLVFLTVIVVLVGIESVGRSGLRPPRLARPPGCDVRLAATA